MHRLNRTGFIKALVALVAVPAGLLVTKPRQPAEARVLVRRDTLTEQIDLCCVRLDAPPYAARVELSVFTTDGEFALHHDIPPFDGGIAAPSHFAASASWLATMLWDMGQRRLLDLAGAQWRLVVHVHGVTAQALPFHATSFLAWDTFRPISREQAIHQATRIALDLQPTVAP